MSEDRMSLKYVLHLTAPERQWLTWIAKGRGERRCPARGKSSATRGRPARVGRTRRSRPRWTSRPAAWGALAAPSRDGAPGLGPVALQTGRRGGSASPAVGPVHAVRWPCALEFAPARPRAGRARDRGRDQLGNRAPHAEKTN